jgi:hypothetical protein
MDIICDLRIKKSILKFIIGLIIILFSCELSNVRGQTIKQIKRQITYRNLAHVKDKEQFGLGGGYVANGFNVDGFYAKYWKKDILFRIDINYETATYALTTMNWFYFSPELNYTIRKVTNRFFINAKAGLILGKENLSNKIMVNHNLNKFSYGEKIGFKMEYFLTPDISLNIDLEQRFINNSNIGTLSKIAIISISYNY